MTRIENNDVILEVSTKGAEITSFKDKKTNIEYMWQGNPDFWAGRNPILFPLVSNTWNKKVNLKGKEYEMGNHGFARNSEFVIENVTDSCITMSLEDNEDTLSVYPYHFKMFVEYKLIGKKCEISYRIENKDDECMPFNFGLHPAFNCPFQNDEKFEDYRIEFSNNETLKGILGPFSLTNEHIMNLNYTVFEENKTICFENPKSSYVTLTNGNHGVKVSIVGYRWLAFWTKDNAPFMCIEPWHSHGDFEEIDVPFENREGTIKLDVNKSYLTSYSIEIY